MSTVTWSSAPTVPSPERWPCLRLWQVTRSRLPLRAVSWRLPCRRRRTPSEKRSRSRSNDRCLRQQFEVPGSTFQVTRTWNLALGTRNLEPGTRLRGEAHEDTRHKTEALQTRIVQEEGGHPNRFLPAERCAGQDGDLPRMPRPLDRQAMAPGRGGLCQARAGGDGEAGVVPCV